MKSGLLKKFAIFGVVAIAMGLSQAKAAITVSLLSGPIPVGPLYQYNYQVSFGGVGNDSDLLTNGNFFTIQNFAGFAGFAATPANWTPSGPVANVLTYTYTDGPVGGGGSPVTIAPFSVLSIYGQTGIGAFTGTISNEQIPSVPTVSSGALIVPAAVVPEPSTLALAGLGLAGLAGYGLRRRSRA